MTLASAATDVVYHIEHPLNIDVQHGGSVPTEDIKEVAPTGAVVVLKDPLVLKHLPVINFLLEAMLGDEVVVYTIDLTCPLLPGGVAGGELELWVPGY